jgi:hypothetical protein
MLRRRAGSLIAGLTLLLIVGGPVAAESLTWVGIGGATGYTLEIGVKAWTIDQAGGGVTNLHLTSPTVVRVRRLSDCVPIVRFVAMPGREYYIRLGPNGTARVEDWTAQGLDAGPGMGDGGQPDCPRLPETSAVIAPAPPATTFPFWALMLVTSGLLGLAFGWRRRSREYSELG